MSSPDSPEPLRRRIAPPVLALLLITGFAGWFVDASYDDVRPPLETNPWSLDARTGAVGSLTTEDPLTVAHRGAELANSAVSSPRASRTIPRDRQLELARSLLRPSSTESVLLLIVWAAGGDWREDVERRRRDRHAVIAAMSAANFALKERRKTHFIEFGPSDIDPSSGAVVAALDVFDGAPSASVGQPSGPASEHSRIAVLWLDEDGLGDKPVERALQIQQQLLGDPQIDVPWPRSPARVQVTHIGPSGSSQLGVVLEELEACASLSAPIHFVSPFATEPAKRARVDLLTRRNSNVRFEPEISTDEQVALLLVGELFQRLPRLDDALASGLTRDSDESPPPLLRALHAATGGVVGDVDRNGAPVVRPRSASDEAPVRVAIVAEQDSAYGRHWKNTMRKAVVELAKQTEHFKFESRLNEEDPSGDFPIRFQLVPYIGVIDGAGAGPRDERRDYPYGSSQLDYLQRLERDLSGERFDAIGVFGTDVSDTLAILHAMRPRFPGALFFTTDMDARYLHKSHLPYTRNLIVASHFGLDDTGTTLHFRDAYEHAMFRAVSRLFKVPASLACPCDLSPRLFEIGRSTAIELNTPWLPSNGRGPSELDAPTLGAIQFANALFKTFGAPADGLHASSSESSSELLSSPAFSVTAAWMHLAVLTAFWLALCAFVWSTSKRTQIKLRSPLKKVALGVSFPVGVLLAAWFVAELQLASEYTVMEPLVLTQGVSAWGAVGLLLLSSGVAVLGISRVGAQLKDMAEQTRARLQLAPVCRSWRQEWAESLRLLHTRSTGGPTEELQRGFASSAKLRWILLRALLAISLVWGATKLIADFDHAAVAERGLVATFLHEWAEFAALTLFVALVYVVVEVTVVCVRIAAEVSRSTRGWFTGEPFFDDFDESAPRGLLRVQEQQRIAAQFISVAEGLPRWPAYVVCVFVLARAPLLDAWMWSNSAAAVLLGALLVLGLCTWRLRRASSILRHEHEHSLEQLSARLAELGRPQRERARVRRALEERRATPEPGLMRAPVIGPLIGPAATFLVSLMSDPAVLQWAAGLSGVSY